MGVPHVPEPNLRVVHVVEATKGGVHTYVRNLIQHQCARGYEVHVLACETLSAAPLADSGACVHRYASSRNPLHLAAVVRQVADGLERVAPDIVHAHSTFAGLYARLAAGAAAGAAMVYQPHGWCFAQQIPPVKKAAYRAIERFLATRTDAIVNISLHDLLVGRDGGVAARRNVLIRNAVPPSAPSAQPYPPPDQGHLNVGFAGRFDRQKGLDILIDIGRRVDNCRFHIAGDFSISARADIDWPANFHHVGWLPPERIDGFYAAMDAMIVPSRWEGFGLVVAEAMRNGCPVIVNSAGALPELVIDGFNGHVLDMRDIETSAALLSSLTRERLRRMGANARTVFDACLGDAAMYTDMDALYGALAKERTHPQGSRVPMLAVGRRFLAARTAKFF